MCLSLNQNSEPYTTSPWKRHGGPVEAGVPDSSTPDTVLEQSITWVDFEEKVKLFTEHTTLTTHK